MSRIRQPPQEVDTEKTMAYATDDSQEALNSAMARHAVSPFAGRLGGNQRFVLNPKDPRNHDLLEETPDASASMTWKSQFDLRPFRNIGLWKAALLEGWGSLMLVYITIWANMSPAEIPLPPTERWGVFNNNAFIGPLIGGIINFMLLTLFTFSFGAVSGAHLNPTITFATFCTRLCSLPRLVLYVAFQTAGGALAGLLARASFGTRDFKVGGCWLYSDVVPVGDAFVVEWMATTTLLFIAFGVGLDPRQRTAIGPSLSPVLVGLALGSISFSTAYTRYGHGGASMNPARCFGAFVGSRFPGWHWIHWVGDFAACFVCAAFYHVIPPGQQQG